jgi:hypothetical protein
LRGTDESELEEQKQELKKEIDELENNSITLRFPQLERNGQDQKLHNSVEISLQKSWPWSQVIPRLQADSSS